MRLLLITTVFMFAAIFSASAQKNSLPLKPILQSYYDLKNALVNTDMTTTTVKATEFSKLVSHVDLNKLTADESKSFVLYQKKLTKDADLISAAKDINKQRDIFAGLSLNIYALAKKVKLSDQPVYQDYCPMKKMYWLSNDVSISNPYYGKTMLNCGSISDTIKP